MERDLPKSAWGEGPWQHEPDREEFRHEGFACILCRGPQGQWCGYVAVPPGHPWHGGIPDETDVEAHGGITYESPCHGEVCHVPEPGESDDVFWLGFDAAHAWDLCPKLNALLGGGYAGPGAVYRDLNYMRDETKRLAEQARDAAK